jgi:hypothetical protein
MLSKTQILQHSSTPILHSFYVDKILKGAKPADLPVQQARKFKFFISLNVAKQIRLTIPVRVLERANKVIKKPCAEPTPQNLRRWQVRILNPILFAFWAIIQLMSPTVARNRLSDFFFSREESRTRLLWRRRGKILVGTAHRVGKECSLVKRSNQGDRANYRGALR